MPKYHWLGGTTNLGRFGMVKRGDVLSLTDKEADSIEQNGPGGERDPRFQVHKADAKIDGAGLDLPEGYEALGKEAQAAARKEAEDARRRAEQLAQSTDPRAGVAGAGATGQPVVSTVETEKARLQRLSAANNETDSENFREMTKAELLEVVDELRGDGKPIDINKQSSRATILRAVLKAKGLSDADVEEEPAGT